MKIGYKHIFFFFITGSILFSSCKKNMPSDVIQPAKMEAVLYDYHIAQAMGNEYNGEERYKKELLIQYVFQKHNTTEAQFDSSLVWYTRNTEELNKIYERVGERLKKSNDIIAAQAGSDVKAKFDPITGDTVDIWRQPKLYRLSSAYMTNKLTFIILTDTTYKIRDSFVWKVNSLFLRDSATNKNAEMELSIRYQNDSIVSVCHNLIEGKNELYISTDTLPIKEVRGGVYYGGDSLSNKIQTLLLHDIALMRYHNPEKEIEKPTEVKNRITVTKTDSIRKIERKDTISEKEPSRLSPQELREQNRPEQIQKKVKPQPRPVPQSNRKRHTSPGTR